jgi:hypothetical protein
VSLVASFDFKRLAEAWGAPLVARKDVAKFSGGLLHPRTMANLDSLGSGPGKILIGRRAFYDTWSLVSWLENRGGKNERA